MKTKRILQAAGVIAAAGLFVNSAAAEDVTTIESQRTERRETTQMALPPATTRTERSITTQSGPMGETITKSTEETWSGRVRRVSPSQVVVAVDGNEYVVTGPKLSELSTEVNQEITFWGHLDQPQKSIEITRYERIDR